MYFAAKLAEMGGILGILQYHLLYRGTRHGPHIYRENVTGTGGNIHTLCIIHILHNIHILHIKELENGLLVGENGLLVGENGLLVGRAPTTKTL